MELFVQHRVLKVVLNLPFSLRAQRKLILIFLEVLDDFCFARVCSEAGRSRKCILALFTNIIAARCHLFALSNQLFDQCTTLLDYFLSRFCLLTRYVFIRCYNEALRSLVWRWALSRALILHSLHFMSAYILFQFQFLKGIDSCHIVIILKIYDFLF